MLSRVITCNFVQLSTPNVRHPHARHMQGVEWNTSPCKNNCNARWHSLTLPTLTMLDWLYKSPGNMPHKYMCPLSGVSLGYWVMTIPRGDSGVQWSERWPYKPGPYRIRDFPQYMPWIGLTVSADTAFAPRQSDDSSGSSVEAFHSWISAKCCGACMQTLRTAPPCEGTCLCIACRVTAPPHPHVARPVKPYQQIWMADRADNLNTNVAGHQLKITAETHSIYARSIPDCIQTSVNSRYTALIGLLPCHVSWVAQIHSHIFLCLAAKVSQSLRNIANSAVIVAASEPSMMPHHWPWLTSIFCHRLAPVDNLARGRSLHSMMIHTSIMDTQRRCHSPSHMPGAKFVEVCPLIAALSQALEPQQNCVRARRDKPCVNGGMLLPPRQVTVSDCQQVKTLVFQGLQLTNIRAGHCKHPSMLGAITHSNEYFKAKARLPKLRRSPPSEAGKSVKVEFSRRMNNPTLSIDIRHQGGAQERASESNTGSAAAETQRHARTPLFLAYHGLNQSTGSCRFVHCTSSHLHHNPAHLAAIAWQYFYLRLSVRKMCDGYQLALKEPALHPRHNLRDMFCLQRPDQSRWQQPQMLVYTGRQCTALPDLKLPITCLAHSSTQLFSFPVNTWARVFPMDPDPKSRQRRRPPSRFRTGQVPLRLWTPQDPARGNRTTRVLRLWQ